MNNTYILLCPKRQLRNSIIITSTLIIGTIFIIQNDGDLIIGLWMSILIFLYVIFTLFEILKISETNLKINFKSKRYNFNLKKSEIVKCEVVNNKITIWDKQNNYFKFTFFPLFYKKKIAEMKKKIEEKTEIIK